MAYSEWYQSFLAHEEALRRERGAPRIGVTFSQRPPPPRPATPPPSVQAQLAAMATVVYAARNAAANRDEKPRDVPFELCGDSIYKRRAAEAQAHRQAASQGLPKQPEKQVAPVMPSADSIYKRRALQAQGLA